MAPRLEMHGPHPKFGLAPVLLVVGVFGVKSRNDMFEVNGGGKCGGWRVTLREGMESLPEFQGSRKQ